MPKPRWEVPLAILAWVRDGTRPSPRLTAGKHGYRVPYRGLSGLDGGSGNIPLQLALAHLAAGVPEALEYLEDRAEDELRHGLGGGEQLSPGYEHLSFWVLVWWTAWKLGHERLCRLSGAWVERHLLVCSLLGRMEGDVLAIYAPGMRADKGADRSVEEAIVSHLLGLHHPLNTNMDREERRWWWGGILVEAVRAAPEIWRVAGRVVVRCRSLLRDKTVAKNTGPSWRGIAYHVPVEVAVFGPQEWLSWMLLGGAHWTGHPQDPAMVWGGVIGGRPTVGLPYELGENPAEGGWGATGPRPPNLDVVWHRSGHIVRKSMPDFPRRPLFMLHLGEPETDPLADLPPIPDGGGSFDPKPPPPEDPRDEEEDPMPEEPAFTLDPRDIRASDWYAISSAPDRRAALIALRVFAETTPRGSSVWKRLEPAILKAREETP